MPQIRKKNETKQNIPDTTQHKQTTRTEQDTQTNKLTKQQEIDLFRSTGCPKKKCTQAYWVSFKNSIT